jgi:uncharacterized protein with HEPN domain
LAGHLTDDFKNEYDNISWQDMIRMRNIAVHHYTKFDLGHLWETIKNDIPELKLFCQNYLKQNDVPIEQPTSSPKFRP